MRYIDTKPSFRSFLLLIFLGVVLYLPMLAVPVLLHGDESLLGAYVQDVSAGRGGMQTHLYGQAVPDFPLYSWLASLCSKMGLPSAFTLRLPSVLALMILAVVSGLFAYHVQQKEIAAASEDSREKAFFHFRMDGPYSGLMASVVVLTSLVSFFTACRAQSELLGALLLGCGWYLWYLFGVEKKNWYHAWGIALVCVFVAQLAIGCKAPFLFYLPLFFLNERFGITDKMQNPAHLVPLLAFGILTVIWFSLVPDQPYFPWNAVRLAEGTSSSLGFWKSFAYSLLPFYPTELSAGSYFGHLVSMLPKCFALLFPWTFLAWGPFCIALRQFERDSLACQFLRIIVLVNVIFFWLLPGGSPRHLLPVLGPLAVLIGIHSEIILGRYRRFWQKLLFFSAWVLTILAFVSFLLFGAILFDFVKVAGLSAGNQWIGLAISALILLMAPTQILFSKTRSFRSEILLCILGFRMLCLILLVVPRAALGQWSVRMRQGEEFRQYVAGKTVYLDWPEQKIPAQILVETFYMHAPVCLVRDLSKDLPKENELYLLSTREPPVAGYELTQLANGKPIQCGARTNWKPFYDLKWRKRPWVTVERETVTQENSKEFRLYKAVKKHEKTDKK